ncbi:MAG: ChrR family anti-sigma-E factor [Myxococcota bacterium]
MAQHHAPDELLLAYAAGELSDSEAMLVACHLTLCPESRAFVALAEAMGGALLSEQSPNSVDADALDRVMGRLDSMDMGDSRSFYISGNTVDQAIHDPHGIVPSPLYRLTGPLDRLSWFDGRTPGVKMAVVPSTIDDRFTLLAKLQPGIELPSHSHPGFEMTLVLAGGYRDDTDKTFVRGDMDLRDSDRSHQQWIDNDEPCLWLVVAQGPPIFNKG